MIPHLGHCAHCGAEDTGDDSWAEFPDITIAPGHRGPAATSTVTTIISGYLVCGACLVSPWGQALRDILTAPWAAPAGNRGDCAILCTGRSRRRRLIAHHFKRESATCPVCYRDATVEHVELEDRPTIWDRMAARITQAAARKGTQLAGDAGELWREWTTYGPPQAPEQNGETTDGDTVPAPGVRRHVLAPGLRRRLARRGDDPGLLDRAASPALEAGTHPGRPDPGPDKQARRHDRDDANRLGTREPGNKDYRGLGSTKRCEASQAGTSTHQPGGTYGTRARSVPSRTQRPAGRARRPHGTTAGLSAGYSSSGTAGHVSQAN